MFKSNYIKFTDDNFIISSENNEEKKILGFVDRKRC